MEPSAAGGADFTFRALVEHADPIVQGVMIVLVLASILSWMLAVEKLIRFLVFSRRIRRVEQAAAKASGTERGLVSRLRALVAAEPRDHGEGRHEYLARLERSLQMEGATQLRQLQSGLPFLATVGSTAPFIGLFGTVWGIMHSFIGIAAAKDTSLAVVAPGIAEALLATAVGLAAAIPAVIIYNQANVSLSRMAERMSIAIGRFAKANAYESVGRSNLETNNHESRVLTNGGIDAR
jgi:biopolymer transport protein ExbB/TolQ